MVITALLFINSRKEILYLNLLATPTETMLAEAPTIVKFPPRQAPKERGLSGIPNRLNGQNH